MKKKFVYEFEDESPRRISFEYDDSFGDYQFDVVKLEDQIGLHLSKSACMVLAKALLKMALCNYEKGFHFHLNKNLNSEQSELMWIGVE